MANILFLECTIFESNIYSGAKIEHDLRADSCCSICLITPITRQVIDGKDITISKRSADDVIHGNWEKFVIKQSRSALKYLAKIDELEDINEQQ